MSEVADEARSGGGEWRPADRPGTVPLWAWPPRPLATLKWVFAYPGYLFPWNAIYFPIALLTWAYLTPELSRAAEFGVDWIAEIYFRNLALLVLWVGGWHLRLYRFKGQGTETKFNPKWLPQKGRSFLFGGQLGENIFSNVAGGCTVWTAYESLFMWGYANGFIEYVDWRTAPVYVVLMLLAVPLWREVHFYWTHRLIHWKPLYRTVHYVHHKNVNVGPRSALSAHPVELIIYFSVALLFWIVPSHPILATFTLVHAALAAAPGHAGFEDLVIKGKAKLPTGGFFHYLHHRYFECNYGSPLAPFDKWFGTFHDGSRGSHARMQARWSDRRAAEG